MVDIRRLIREAGMKWAGGGASRALVSPPALGWWIRGSSHSRIRQPIGALQDVLFVPILKTRAAQDVTEDEEAPIAVQRVEWRQGDMPLVGLRRGFLAVRVPTGVACQIALWQLRGMR